MSGWTELNWTEPKPDTVVFRYASVATTEPNIVDKVLIYYICPSVQKALHGSATIWSVPLKDWGVTVWSVGGSYSMVGRRRGRVAALRRWPLRRDRVASSHLAAIIKQAMKSTREQIQLLFGIWNVLKMQLHTLLLPPTWYKYVQQHTHACSAKMEFGRVSRMKSKYLNDSIVLYHSVRNPGYVYKFSCKKDKEYRCCRCRVRETARYNRCWWRRCWAQGSWGRLI